MFNKKIKGLILVNSQSGVKYTIKGKGIPICYKEDGELEQHYFTNQVKIYSDKLSKFMVRCNDKSEGAVVDRLTRIYSHIFIDEVQDLAGYDLEIIKLIFKSQSNVCLVGDPRQVTYLTHNESKYKKYSNGKIKDFIEIECKKLACEINEDTLSKSHRNNKEICKFSAKLYPHFKECQSTQTIKTCHDGIFLIKKQDVPLYVKTFKPVQLRLNKETRDVNINYPSLNFGESKGLSFDRVLIYPTEDMAKWLKNHNLALAEKTRAQFYVAITRARFSVGIIYESNEDACINGVNKFVAF